MYSVSELLEKKKQFTKQDQIVFTHSKIREIGISSKFQWVTRLMLSNNSIRELKGIEQFKYLEILSIHNNQLQSVSELFRINNSLTTLSIHGNPLCINPMHITTLLLKFNQLQQIDDYQNINHKMYFNWIEQMGVNLIVAYQNICKQDISTHLYTISQEMGKYQPCLYTINQYLVNMISDIAQSCNELSVDQCRNMSMELFENIQYVLKNKYNNTTIQTCLLNQCMQDVDVYMFSQNHNYQQEQLYNQFISLQPNDSQFNRFPYFPLNKEYVYTIIGIFQQLNKQNNIKQQPQVVNNMNTKLVACNLTPQFRCTPTSKWNQQYNIYDQENQQQSNNNIIIRSQQSILQDSQQHNQSKYSISKQSISKQSISKQQSESLNTSIEQQSKLNDRTSQIQSQSQLQHDKSYNDKSQHNQSQNNKSYNDKSQHNQSQNNKSYSGKSLHSKSQLDKSYNNASLHDNSQHNQSLHDKSQHNNSQHRSTQKLYSQSQSQIQEVLSVQSQELLPPLSFHNNVEQQTSQQLQSTSRSKLQLNSSRSMKQYQLKPNMVKGILIMNKLYYCKLKEAALLIDKHYFRKQIRNKIQQRQQLFNLCQLVTNKQNQYGQIMQLFYEWHKVNKLVTCITTTSNSQVMRYKRILITQFSTYKQQQQAPILPNLSITFNRCLKLKVSHYFQRWKIFNLHQQYTQPQEISQKPSREPSQSTATNIYCDYVLINKKKKKTKKNKTKKVCLDCKFHATMKKCGSCSTCAKFKPIIYKS